MWYTVGISFENPELLWGFSAFGNKGNLAQTTALCTYNKYIFVQTKSQKQNAAVRLQGPQGPRQGWNKTLSKFIIIIIIIIIIIVIVIVIVIVIFHHHRPFPTRQGSQRSNHRFVLKTQIFGSFLCLFPSTHDIGCPKLRCIFHGPWACITMPTVPPIKAILTPTFTNPGRPT